MLVRIGMMIMIGKHQDKECKRLRERFGCALARLIQSSSLLNVIIIVIIINTIIVTIIAEEKSNHLYYYTSSFESLTMKTFFHWMYLINWIKLRMTIRDQASWVESDLDHRLGKTQITSSFSGQNLLPWETHIEIQGIMSSVNFWQNIRNQIRQTAQITERQRVRRRRTLLLLFDSTTKMKSCPPTCHTCPMSHHCGVQCLFMWSARWSERENERWQRWHLNGFVPVCFLVCLKQEISVFWRSIVERQWYKWLFGHPQFLKMIPVT